MSQGPDFRHFAAFVAVAEELNFGKAALRVHITQPALTAQIKQLEEWHGEKLFKRGHHGAELTASGRSFLVWARKVLAMIGDSAKATSRKHSVVAWPFRFGFSLFVNHGLVREAIKGHREIVPERAVQSSSDCTARLLEMLNDGRLDAAIVTLPIAGARLMEQPICTERLLICLPKGDPLSRETEIPKAAVPERLRIMFNREYHPEFHDYILKKFRAAGMELRPTETYSAPSEMQFLVRTLNCFGLIRECTPLDPDLTALPIQGVEFRARTAMIFNPGEQQTPILSMLAERMAEQCHGTSRPRRKKPSGIVTMPGKKDVRKTG